MDDARYVPTRRRLLAGVLAGAGLTAGAATGLIATASPAKAYGWSRDLQTGDEGTDVTELQIRVAGWAADGAERANVDVDGVFGSITQAAVKRFQSAYGLSPNGLVGSETQDALNALEASDGSTQHFAFTEFHSKDGSGFSGGKVGSSEVEQNVRRLMYKLEAIRKKSGDNPVTINSGFRSISHNSAVGGASNSQHMYGVATDIVIANRSVSQVISSCQSSGFSGIIRYGSFTHADSRVEYGYGAGSWYWSV